MSRFSAGFLSGLLTGSGIIYFAGVEQWALLIAWSVIMVIVNIYLRIKVDS